MTLRQEVKLKPVAKLISVIISEQAVHKVRQMRMKLAVPMEVQQTKQQDLKKETCIYTLRRVDYPLTKASCSSSDDPISVFWDTNEDNDADYYTRKSIELYLLTVELAVGKNASSCLIS